MVEYASTRLTSFCATAIVAANRAVNAPMNAITVIVGLPPCAPAPAESSGNMRTIMYTPAETMAAA